MPGDDIEEGLLSAVTNANVIVALISQSLIADNLLYKGLELVLKLERTKNMALIPVKIKQFFSELEKELHLLPSSGQKLSDMEDTAEAWREVARAIEICILQIKANLELIHYKNLVDRYRSKFGDIIE
ncbi:MAG TPA: toll/interleukin-1 receptor domain-containing protein [Chitinophagales bacterium]|nr:toll/interleukin-1 receptor domain-containing protein [Chitinophagales bacterium]